MLIQFIIFLIIFCDYWNTIYAFQTVTVQKMADKAKYYKKINFLNNLIFVLYFSYIDCKSQSFELDLREACSAIAKRQRISITVFDLCSLI